MGYQIVQLSRSFHLFKSFSAAVSHTVDTVADRDNITILQTVSSHFIVYQCTILQRFIPVSYNNSFLAAEISRLLKISVAVLLQV